jgi:hypothetical protein
VHSYATVENSILMQGAIIGRHARLRNVICDRYSTIEDGAVIGEDLDADARRFTVSPGGVVVIPKGAVVPASGPVEHNPITPPPGSIRPRELHPGSISSSEGSGSVPAAGEVER